MPRFQSSRESLRDIRTAYIFLLSLAVVATVFGVIATRLDGDLNENRMDKLRSSLNMCADSLDSWRAEGSFEEQYSAAAHFSAALSSLPDDVPVEGLLKLSEEMAKGEAAAEVVTSFSDAFSLLSSLGYATPDEGAEVVAATIGELSKMVYPADDVEGENVALPPPEVSNYSKKIARRTIDNMFGVNAVGLTVIQDDKALTAKTGNLRMSFSAEDGSLEEFIYIRLNEKGEITLSEGERVDAALDFFHNTVRHRSEVNSEITNDICGFLVVDITAGEEKWRTAVDGAGKVWSFFKVVE